MTFSPSLQRTIALLGGAGIVAFSLWLQRQAWMGGFAILTWGLLMAGLFFFILGAREVQGGQLPKGLAALVSRFRTWLGIEDWQLALLGISPFLVAIAALAAGTDLKMNNPVVAVLTWLVGIGFAFIGGWRFGQTRKPLSRPTAITFGGLVIFALLIRAVFISNIPIVLTGDEASAGLSAVDILRGVTNNIFRAGWFSFPALHSFIQSVPIALLGQTTSALRLTSVVAGALTVGCVYWLARGMFGEQTALFSAIFLAGFNFHNHFSRIGLNNIWDGFWFMIVLGALWYGWNMESREEFLFAGLSLGISQYFYVSVRLLFVLIPLWLIISGLSDRGRLKRVFPDLLIMGLVTLATVLPLAWFYIRFPNEFMAPLNRVSVLGQWMTNEIGLTDQPVWKVLLNQLALSFQGYTHEPLRMWYQPGTPLLRPIPATLFLLGIGLIVFNWRQNRSLLFGLWIISFGFMTGLSEGTPAAQRYVAVTPAVALIVGYGLAEFSTLLGRLWPVQARMIAVLALAVIVLLSVDELRFYFFDYTPRSDFGGDNTMVAQRLAEYLKGKPNDWQVLFFGFPRMGYYSIASLPYLAPHIQGLDMNHPWGSTENPLPSSDHLIFVFLPGLETDLHAVQASFPGGRLLREMTNDGRLLYWLYELSSGQSDSLDAQPIQAGYPHTAPIHLPNFGGYP